MDKSFPKNMLSHALVLLGSAFLASSHALAEISIDQQPIAPTKPVPANVAIVGSFEFPTMVTRAYLEGSASAVENTADDDEEVKSDSSENQNTYYDNLFYIGYFDNKKCYEYHYDEKNEKKRHFFPVKFADDKTRPALCPADTQWSGNFLNWASMQTIDIFRHTLTGGRRSTDTETETILEKGMQSGQGLQKGLTGLSPDALFPIGKVSILTNRGSKEAIKNAAPVRWNWIRTRIGQNGVAFGNELRFTESGTLKNFGLNLLKREYNPEKHKPGSINFPRVNVYKVSVRVKVCVPDLLESNCVKQPNGNYKPVGLIQNYAEEQGVPRMRFSAFGYLNDALDHADNRNRKGGVMHARMKYVGPHQANAQNVVERTITESDCKTGTPTNPNPHAEWNACTGVFIDNPDPTDAAATPKGKKAVQHSGVISYINNSGHLVKDTKFKQFDNVSELYYTAYRYMKGLPNIAAYSNVSDKTNEALDRLVGGLPIIQTWNTNEEHLAEVPVGNDPIQFSCQKNFVLGIGDSNTHNDWGIVNDGADDSIFQNTFNELRNNMHSREGITDKYSDKKRGSDYIAVLAYDANTNDLRPNMPGKQTMQTYWVDILEYTKNQTSIKEKSRNPYWMATKYGGFKVPEGFKPTRSITQLDQSLWSTSGEKLVTDDLRPDNYFPVNNPQKLINSLTQAFKSIQEDQSGADGSIAISDVDSDADLMTFQSRYVSGSWTGNLYGYKIDPTTQMPKNTPEWDAESQLPKWEERNVYINSSTFKKLAKDASNIDGLTKDQVNYLLGDRSKETDDTFRRRTAILGDIVNSEPVYVGRPRIDAFSTRSFDGVDKYLEFAQGKASRQAMVYVGGNDGMLHGFDAKTGVEKFAFIPATVVANNLASLTDKNYLHRYSVDGEISVADVYINKTWKTILVGTLGAGGVATDRKTVNNAVFALDVTDPENISLLWEKTSADIPALGITLGKPSIIQNDKNQWKVVLGNGPNSKNKTTSLISIDFFGGSVTTTELDSGSGANGLSALRTWDSTGDGLTDTLYAGDFKGQLWKITNLSGTPKAIKLFTAVDKEGVAQPITSAPLAGVSPYDRTTWLFFGTGRYLSVADVVDTQLQTWYGIKDNGKKQQTRNTLLERHIIAEQNVSAQGDITVARVLEKGSLDELVDKQGWFIDLYRIIKGDPDKYTEDKINGKPTINGERAQYGERMVHSNQFKDRALISNTVVPNAQDACAPYGSGMIMAINPFTGGRLDDTFFDVNKDGDFTSADEIMFGKNAIPVSGVSIKTGTSSPTFLGNTMLSSEPTGQLPQAINPYLGDALKPSWRELINREN